MSVSIQTQDEKADEAIVLHRPVKFKFWSKSSVCREVWGMTEFYERRSHQVGLVLPEGSVCSSCPDENLSEDTSET